MLLFTLALFEKLILMQNCALFLSYSNEVSWHMMHNGNFSEMLPSFWDDIKAYHNNNNYY